ncbi:GlsB/YeaQ/YmgE family stress response membrane protein [Veronia pacifica]|uniref:Transglycosylase n=1 Tax=Veronia pacifica TaxID=1080227 RepID=A0A1C3EJP6_9GAMM|nr:GlsB/YeaQ/YmgE family stress response membrane protein [Veronia pacifica]ODA33449.1 hypothetical protein A8L45_10395 [Veronia pacifica]
MGIISWILSGLFFGVLTRLLTPVRRPDEAYITVLLGIGGAVTAGWTLSLLSLTSPKEMSFIGLTAAVIGAIIPLLIYVRHFR